MEQRTQKVDTTLLLDEYRVLLETVDQLPLLISGNSMSPFLVHGRDTVFLTKVDRHLRRGDIVLYRRKTGAYILHRICAVRGDTFSMVGDAQTEIEHDIEREQIYALVCAAVRKGHRQKPGCFWWAFFEHCWVRLIPVRPILLRVYGTLKRLFRRKV